MAQSKFVRSLAGMFSPPFIGLAWLVGIYFVACYIFFPGSPILRGDLSDTDDYTYLVQAIDWLKGQSWFDNTQYRLAPPDGVELHFSRLAQLPIAALISYFRLFNLSWLGAATLTTLFLPLIWLVCLFNVLRWASRGFVSADWSRATAFVVLFSSSFIYKFSIGHIDHHSLIALLVLLALGGIVRLLEKPSDYRWAVGTGFVLALAMAVALEALPWILIMTAIVGVSASLRGKQVARAGAAYSVSLFLFSAFFLVVLKTPQEWFTPALVVYSFVYVVMSAYIAVCFVAVALAAETGRRYITAAVGCVVAVAMGSFFLSSYPELIKGPYGAMDPALAKLFFDFISEAIPLVKKVSLDVIFVRILCPSLALGYSLFRLYHAKDDTVDRWMLWVVLLASSILLTTFYQIRFITFAYAFAVIPLTAMLEQGWKACGSSLKGRRRFWAEIGLIMLVGPIPMVFVPALWDGRPFNTGITMFPYQGISTACEMSKLEHVLRSPEYFGKKSLVIMNGIDLGPELLFRTEHKVMAAPYHTNVRGNLDAHKFFSTKNPDEAKQIAKRNGVELVVFCRMVSYMYLGKGPTKAQYNKDGTLKVSPDASFVEQLFYRKTPAWLKEFTKPKIENYLILEVVKDKM